MKNKNVSKKVCVDYIPKDGFLLCKHCKYFERCPEDYVCPSLKRKLDDEFSEGYEE